MSEQASKKIRCWPVRSISTAVLLKTERLYLLVREYLDMGEYTEIKFQEFLFRTFFPAIAKIFQEFFTSGLEGFTFYILQETEDYRKFLRPLMYWNDRARDDEMDVIVRQSDDRKIYLSGENDYQEGSIAGYFGSELRPNKDWGEFFEINNDLSGVFVGAWFITDITALPEHLTQRTRSVFGEKDISEKRFSDVRMILIKSTQGTTEELPYPQQVCQIVLSEEFSLHKKELNKLCELMNDVFLFLQALNALSCDLADKMSISLLRHCFVDTQEENRILRESNEELKTQLMSLKTIITSALSNLVQKVKLY